MSPNVCPSPLPLPESAPHGTVSPGGVESGRDGVATGARAVGTTSRVRTGQVDVGYDRGYGILGFESLRSRRTTLP